MYTYVYGITYISIQHFIFPLQRMFFRASIRRSFPSLRPPCETIRVSRSCVRPLESSRGSLGTHIESFESTKQATIDSLWPMANKGTMTFGSPMMCFVLRLKKIASLLIGTMPSPQGLGNYNKNALVIFNPGMLTKTCSKKSCSFGWFD